MFYKKSALDNVDFAKILRLLGSVDFNSHWYSFGAWKLNSLENEGISSCDYFCL